MKILKILGIAAGLLRSRDPHFLPAPGAADTKRPPGQSAHLGRTRRGLLGAGAERGHHAPDSGWHSLQPEPAGHDRGLGLEAAPVSDVTPARPTRQGRRHPPRPSRRRTSFRRRPRCGEQPQAPPRFLHSGQKLIIPSKPIGGRGRFRGDAPPRGRPSVAVREGTPRTRPATSSGRRDPGGESPASTVSSRATSPSPTNITDPRKINRARSS